MKILLAAILCLFTVPAFAATGTTAVPYQQLSPDDFDVTQFPLVTIFFDTNQFTAHPLRIKNNIFVGAQDWTNISGVLQPTTGVSVLVTNLIATSNSVFSGTLTLAKKTQLLTLGTNAVDCTTSSMFYGVSPTNDPTQVILSLSAGHQPGQLLLLVNYTNAVPNNGAFTLPAQSSVTGSGGGHVIMPEDWVSTNTFSAFFTWQSPDWLMIDAFAANGQSIWQTNIFNTLIVNSNLTVRGKFVINNVTITTNDLWQAVGGTNLQPVNLALQPTVKNGWFVGTNSQAIWGSPLTGGQALVTIQNVGAGDPNNSVIWSEVINGGTDSGWYAQQNVAQGSFNLFHDSGLGNPRMHWEIGDANMAQTWDWGGTNFLRFNPGISDGTTPHRLGTMIPHTTGNLFEVANVTTNVFTVLPYRIVVDAWQNNNPTVVIRQNLTNTSSQGAVQFIASDSDGQASLGYLQAFEQGGWDLGTPGTRNGGLTLQVQTANTLQPRMSILGDTSGIRFFDNTGTLNGLIANNSGYTGTGTNVLTDNGTYVPLPGGGGGGTALWYQYTVPDAEGGTVYGTGSTNSFYPNMVRFSNNFLTNFFGDFSGSVSIGANTPDPSTFDSTENTGVFNIGDTAGSLMTATNSGDIFNIGANTGHSMSLDSSFRIINLVSDSGNSATIQDSSEICNYGDAAGSVMILTNSHNIYNYGENAGTGMAVTNSQNIYNYGIDSGRDMVVTNSSFIFNFGFGAGISMTLKDSGAIYANGHHSLDSATLSKSQYVYSLNGAFQGALLTNSVNVTGIGQHAGDGVTGSLTNVYFIGSGSTAPDGSYDQVVLGSGMGLTTGDSGGGIAVWKLGQKKTGVALTLVATNYVEVNINGSIVKLAIVQ